MAAWQRTINRDSRELADRLRHLATQIENGEIEALLATVFHADGQIERLDDLAFDAREPRRNGSAADR